ncbi:MAG TPA: glycosyltransferase [Telluria sp.]
MAALPAFCFGFIEDLTKRVSVRTRLLATMASGVMAWLLMDISITHTGLWGIDTALAWLPFSVLFTSFAVGGVANAVNIIDGFNGLASGTVAICIFALGMIASQVGDSALATMCFVTCAAIAGFLVVNFPFGKLFLGDGGAYMLGFLLAWLAIMLPARNPSVSVWASFLVCGYPIFETMFTIARRVWTRTHPGLADSSHLHSLVKVGVSDQLFAGLRPQFANALVSPFCWAIAALAATLAVRHAGDTGALVLATVSSFLVYLGCYWGVTKAASQSVRKPARPPLTIVASNKIDKFAKSKTYVSGNPEPSVDDDDIVRARMG